jgi:hypothetical protein
MRVTDANGATATANLGITILSAPPTTPPPTTPTPLAITSSGTLPGGVASTSYNTSLNATGGTTPYNWAIQSCSGVCNAGLSLSPAGVLSGTPINSGTSTYTVGVIDATGQSASGSVNLTIAAATSSSTANYFVSPSGSNSNPCTQTSPCPTPDYVFNNKAPRAALAGSGSLQIGSAQQPRFASFAPRLRVRHRSIHCMVLL